MAGDHPGVVKRILGYAAAFNADLAAHRRTAGFVEEAKPLTLPSRQVQTIGNGFLSLRAGFGGRARIVRSS